MIEDYVSYEVARLLKKKGFDEKTLAYYEGYILVHGDWFEWNRSPLSHISAPTHQMAMKWLREVHNIDIEIRRSPNTMMYRCIVYKDTLVKCITDAVMDSYEEAVEAALKYSLENLI